MRLDRYLVDNEHYRSRHQAQMEIRNGSIKVNDEIVIKPSYQVNPNDQISITAVYNPYASIGGLKLEKALHVFKIEVLGKTIIDIGASTGGFTECLLNFGAKKVYAVDVGTDQLAKHLLNNDKVVSYSKTNFLNTNKDHYNYVDYIMIDVSFTSAIPIIEHAYKLYDVPIIWLVKPQFETMKPHKSGVIKSAREHKEILAKIILRLNKLNKFIVKFDFSPLKGRNGNIEFLSLIGGKKAFIDINEIINQAHELLL